MRRALAAAAVLALLSAGGAWLLLAARRVGSSQGYAPAQPIAFSHRLHAGENRIPCQYCHFAAERSRHAGIPPLAVCMGCHSRLQVESAEVQKLTEAVAQGRAVSWVKVHNLPDFVAFHHGRHLLGGLRCQTCHGPVETMDRVRQVESLGMGWCIGCHRERARAVARAVPANHVFETPSTDCARCHY